MNKINKETKAYKNKLNYISEYNKKNCKIYSFKLHKENDKELIEFFEQVPSRSQTIRDMYEVYKKHR